MRLTIHHRTRYRYSLPVVENYNELRLQPVSDETQECHAYRVSTVPGVKIQRYHDFHLNLVDHFYVTESHRELVVDAFSEVTTLGRRGRFKGVNFPMARLGECQRLERCYDFLQRSEYVSLGVDVWRMAKDAAAGLDDAWSAGLALMRYVHREFTYEAQATTVDTHVDEVVARRRGVCQDFAHVLIGMCRALGLPARYVSGYLYVGQESGWRGDLASHAWVEVFLPGHGWLPLDPTNDRPADEHHVKVSVGRDYADAAPLRGSFKGRAVQSMEVTLRIDRVDEPESAGGESPGAVASGE